MTKDTKQPLLVPVLASAFAGLTDDALAHLVLIGMLSTLDAQAARKARTDG